MLNVKDESVIAAGDAQPRSIRSMSRMESTASTAS
jgi:hypothetical protein